MIHGGSHSVRPVKGRDKVGAPAPDKGGSGGGKVVRAQREGPDYLQNRRLFTMDVDAEDPIQTLYDDIVTYLKGFDKGRYEFFLDNGKAQVLPRTFVPDGGYNEFYIELMSSSTYTESSDHLVLWINLEDFYIVGFRTRTESGQWIGSWREYKPKPRKISLIEESTPLSFGNSYSDMFQAIMIKRKFDSKAHLAAASKVFHTELPIGRDALIKAFSTLKAPAFSEDEAALSLMRLSTMVCESLRLKKFLARLKSAFSQNQNVPFCVTDHQLVWMWGTSSHVFDLACTSPEDERLLGIKALMPGGIKETLLQEIGILKCLDKHGKRFCGHFRRDYAELLEARRGHKSTTKNSYSCFYLFLATLFVLFLSFWFVNHST